MALKKGINRLSNVLSIGSYCVFLIYEIFNPISYREKNSPFIQFLGELFKLLAEIFQFLTTPVSVYIKDSFIGWTLALIYFFVIGVIWFYLFKFTVNFFYKKTVWVIQGFTSED